MPPSVCGDVGAEMKSFWDFKSYLKEQTDDGVIEFVLDDKTKEEVIAFLAKYDIEYVEGEDGIIYVAGDDDEKEEPLDEASATRKIVIRKGRKKIIFKCGPGKKKVGKTCIVRKSSELMRMKRRAIKSARKSRSKRSQSNRLRKRSNTKRSTMGLNRRKR